MKIKILLTCLLVPCCLLGIDYRPWYPKWLEPQAQLTYLFQSYQSLERPGHDVHHSSQDSFVFTSLGMAALGFYGELDLNFAKTHERNFAVDSYYIEARYQIFDDVADEDPVSLIAGITIGKASRPALHDYSSFHHAQFEGEIHVAVGKEKSCEQFWTSRWWGVLGIGGGDVGSPWIRCNANWEKNYLECGKWGVFINTLWGLGGNNLSRREEFKGYGPIAHRSIDLGAFYTYPFECGGEFTVSYAFRPYAFNFPQNTSLFSLTFLHPFGTGI